MDSRVVNKEIKRTIWTLLKSEGFTKFTTRNAWRIKEETVEVVNFQSFNSYLASGIGCTTYSFGVNLGVYYKCFEETAWFKKVRLAYPPEYESHERKDLRKNIGQIDLFLQYKGSRFPKRDRPGVWYVIEDGKNLIEVINDAKQAIIADGLPWFAKMTNLPIALEVIENEIDKKRGMSWSRAEIISALSLKLDKPKNAIKAYQEVVHNNFYIRIHEYEKIAKKPSGEDYLEVVKKRIAMIHMIK
jgi:hypothetical protein